MGSTLLVSRVCNSNWAERVAVQSFFGFGQSADIKVELTDVDDKRQVAVKQDNGQVEQQYLYFDGEAVSGNVRLMPLRTARQLSTSATTVGDCQLEIPWQEAGALRH